MEEMFKYLDYLEEFYKKEFISLDNYYHIKECIIESYRPVKEKDSEEFNLPFYKERYIMEETRIKHF